MASFIERASSSGGDLGLRFARFSRATLDLGDGDVEVALRATERLVRRHAEGCMFHAWAQALHGTALARLGDPRAPAALAEARAVATKVGNPRWQAMADPQLGLLAMGVGDLPRAASLLHLAMATRRAAAMDHDAVASLEALGRLAAAQESPAEALRLFAAAAERRARTTMPCPPAEQSSIDAGIAHARSQLSEAAAAAAWGEGEGLDLDAAVAYATRARGERRRPSAGWESLTPTEVAVVRLAAEGLTNPMIAERLFIGRGTVKTHLSHVFAKLGIATRAELAAKATSRDV